MGKSKAAAKYLKENGLADNMKNAVHIVWATGGSLVPEEERVIKECIWNKEWVMVRVAQAWRSWQHDR